MKSTTMIDYLKDLSLWANIETTFVPFIISFVSQYYDKTYLDF